jgi:crotonobetainyl-CoA:carnitine CoA-transferase CaiB-like acyl-CoA transferase
MIEHPQTVARQMVVEVVQGNGRIQKQIGAPLKFSGSQPEYKHTGVKLGAHNEEVLAEIGYSAAEIAELQEGGVLG